MTALLLVGLAVFCVVFAVNSSIHSYLIVRYSGGDKVASSVGFYYMSNAAGRFVGTLCSGAIYQYAAVDKAVGLGCASSAIAVSSLLPWCTRFTRWSVLTRPVNTMSVQVLLCGVGCGFSCRDAAYHATQRPRCWVALFWLLPVHSSSRGGFVYRMSRGGCRWTDP